MTTEREVFNKLLDFFESTAYIGALKAADRHIPDAVLREHKDIRAQLTEALCDEP